MTDSAQAIAKIIYDVADAVDGEKDGKVTELNFKAVVDIFDRLDTPLGPNATTIDDLKGNGFISTNAVGSLAAYIYYEPENRPTTQEMMARSKLDVMGTATDQLAETVHTELAEGALVAEADIWAYARGTLGFYPRDVAPASAPTVKN